MRRLWNKLFGPKCQHDWYGVVNYYDQDTKVFLQLLQCRKCDTAIIAET